MGSPTGQPPPRHGLSRRGVLIGGLAGVAGAAGAAAIPLALDRDRPARAAEAVSRRRPLRNCPAAARAQAFNAGWVFGEYSPGSEQPGYDDARHT